MALLAHWPIDDGYLNGPTVVRDVAGGGSGDHDGVPQSLSSTWNYGNYRPGGVGGHHLHKRSNSYEGAVRSIANNSDFLLSGEVACSAWVAHDDAYYSWAFSDRAIAGASSDGSGLEAGNAQWWFQTKTDRQLQLSWLYGAGSLVEILSGGTPLPLNGWVHVGVERYEVISGFWGAKFYVNGSLWSTQDNGGAGWPAPTGGSLAQMNLACSQTWHGGYELNYDSVRVYDAAVGAAQMLADFNADIAAGHPGSAGQGGVVKTDNPTGFQDGLYNVGDGSLSYLAIPSGPLSLRDFAGWSEQ